MRTQVAHTSIETYHSLPVRDYLQPKEAEVMDLMSKVGTLTREQIALRLGWKESSVCGRVNSLVCAGHLEEIDGGRTASGKSAKLVRIPLRGQRELFQ